MRRAEYGLAVPPPWTGLDWTGPESSVRGAEGDPSFSLECGGFSGKALSAEAVEMSSVWWCRQCGGVLGMSFLKRPLSWICAAEGCAALQRPRVAEDLLWSCIFCSATEQLLECHGEGNVESETGSDDFWPM
uniref:Uncharacterized protein n=1 Tax=Knipowitschia caucasica TaxID=637954 RepID=A0AAV2J019_KNICA